ncbi:MAG: B12-binding domain-containing radical SAM protein [Promethearchaeota archaeon]
MKILYVNPARLESGLDAIIKGEPLSLISIAGMISKDHKAKLFDFKVDKFSENRFRRELNRTDVVAITSMTPQIDYALEVAKMAKEQGCYTILGGYHSTLVPEFVAKHPYVDFTVRGEGEHTFKELIDFIDGNKNRANLKEIKGVSYLKKSDGKIRHNIDRPLEPNLDNFGMPRRDLLKGKKYSYMGAITSQVETSRGCPHNCKFCCIIKMWKDKTQHLSYRSKSLKRIMRELYSIDKHKDFIFFCEDNFTINVKRTQKILDAITISGINSNFNFSCQSRVDTLYRNPWLIDKMDKAGIKQVFLGIESVHQQSLEAMNKRNTTPYKVKTVVKMLQDKGISIFGGIIIGFPGETKKMVRQNIAYAKSLKLTCVQFTPITAFPGTTFYDEMKDQGMITSNNYKNYDLFHPMMNTPQLSNKDLLRLVAEAYAAYYLKSDWIKIMGKRYLNPLGKFNWMIKSMPRLIKQMLFGGVGMLHKQGISKHVISKELNYYIEHLEIIEKLINRKVKIERKKRKYSNNLMEKSLIINQ